MKPKDQTKQYYCPSYRSTNFNALLGNSPRKKQTSYNEQKYANSSEVTQENILKHLCPCLGFYA